MVRWMLLVPLLPLAAPAAEAVLPTRLPQEEAWKRLPDAPATAQRLPAWARMLAGPMPITTARMLELDALHRSGDRLDARLRGLVRWAAADANGCAYSREMAAADLRRAGYSQAFLKDPSRQPERLSQLDRLAMAFARKMMREAHAVTDAEVKQLISLAGEERVVALVALLAHASFHDRVVLVLGLTSEEGGAVPPVTARFGRPKPPQTPNKKPASPRPSKPAQVEAPIPTADPDYQRLREGLKKQLARSGRIRIPSREEVLERIGAEHSAAWQANILWSRVCYGYQPELTDAWFDCVAAFRQESNIDGLFGNAIFWVVTHANDCFY
ncbi:MAG: hypothetical protein U0840_23390 [Gemmataceae bacterium]